MYILKPIITCLLLAGCNSIYVKPNSLDTSQTIFADRGGYSMRRSIKLKMSERGYNVVVGTAKSTSQWSDSDTDIELNTNVIPSNARYIVKVNERREKFNAFWCPFNGFWWWNFNISVSDQISGEEIMSWRGRGCADSTLRKLNKVLDTMEIKNEQ